MTKALQFTDEELTAFLDGEAEERLAQAIEAALESDSALERRLMSLEIPLEAVREAFDLAALGAPAMPRDLFDQAPAAQEPRFDAAQMAAPVGPPVAANSPFRPFAVAASVALALVVGGLGGYALKETPPAPQVAAKPGWIAQVASYQALYTAETLEGPAQAAVRTAEVLTGFAARVGADLSPVTEVDGLSLKQAQVLSFNGKPLLQMAFLGNDGVPYALCVIASAKDARDMKDQIAQGLAASSWIEDGVGYLVIGGADARATRAHADAMRAQLQRG